MIAVREAWVWQTCALAPLVSTRAGSRLQSTRGQYGDTSAGKFPTGATYVLGRVGLLIKVGRHHSANTCYTLWYDHICTFRLVPKTSRRSPLPMSYRVMIEWTIHCLNRICVLYLLLSLRELLRKSFAKESDVCLAQPATLLAIVIATCAPWDPTGLDLIAVPCAWTCFTALNARCRAKSSVALYYSGRWDSSDVLCSYTSGVRNNIISIISK